MSKQQERSKLSEGPNKPRREVRGVLFFVLGGGRKVVSMLEQVPIGEMQVGVPACRGSVMYQG